MEDEKGARTEQHRRDSGQDQLIITPTAAAAAATKDGGKESAKTTQSEGDSNDGDDDVDNTSKSKPTEKTGKKGEDNGRPVEEDEEVSRLDILADLREEQRARRKAGGRSVSALMGSRRQKAGAQALAIKGHGMTSVGFRAQLAR